MIYRWFSAILGWFNSFGIRGVIGEGWDDLDRGDEMILIWKHQSDSPIERLHHPWSTGSAPSEISLVSFPFLVLYLSRVWISPIISLWIDFRLGGPDFLAALKFLRGSRCTIWENTGWEFYQGRWFSFSVPWLQISSGFVVLKLEILSGLQILAKMGLVWVVVLVLWVQQLYQFWVLSLSNLILYAVFLYMSMGLNFCIYQWFPLPNLDLLRIFMSSPVMVLCWLGCFNHYG